ncbi:protein of unknown function (plasmid) [Rhodovastum atsumiense]|nr:protein of unknown function [Rhodovastum atsumiense]
MLPVRINVPAFISRIQAHFTKWKFVTHWFNPGPTHISMAVQFSDLGCGESGGPQVPGKVN